MIWTVYDEDSKQTLRKFSTYQDAKEWLSGQDDYPNAQIYGPMLSIKNGFVR